VNYNLPKSMGSSVGWTDEDRVSLCRACVEVSEDPATATGRFKDQLCAAVHEIRTDLMTKKGPLRVKRNRGALEKQFKKIRKGVSSFTSHNLAIENIQTTGNLKEEDIISGAVAWVLLAGHLRVHPQPPEERQAQEQEGKKQSQTGALRAGWMLARFPHI